MDSDIALVPGIGLAILFLLLGVMALHATRVHRGRMPFQVKLFLAAFLVRFLASVALYQFDLARLLGDDDAQGWAYGAKLAEEWTKNNIGFLDLPYAIAEALKYQNRGYQYLLGGYFWVTGVPGRLPAAALNCLFGALAVVVIYRTASRLFSQWVAVRVAWWTCFFPSLIIWSAMTLKEPLVVLLEAIAVYACVRLREVGPAPRYLAICAIALILLLPLRFYAPFLLGPPILLSLISPGIGKLKSGFAALLLVATLAPIALGSTAFLRTGELVRSYDLSQVETFRNAVSSGGASKGAASGVKVGDLRTPGGLAIGVAGGAAHLLLSPFPWELGGASARMLMSLPELVVWWYLFFFGVVPGLVYCVRKRLKDVSILLLFTLIFGGVYSMMFGNVGLAFRQRGQLLPWLLMFAAAGLEVRARQKRMRQMGLAAAPVPVHPAVAPARSPSRRARAF